QEERLKMASAAQKGVRYFFITIRLIIDMSQMYCRCLVLKWFKCEKNVNFSQKK
ncbi:MAG: hypothetical protein ACI9XO_004997, partial [Paraglaciecola sp.]